MRRNYLSWGGTELDKAAGLPPCPENGHRGLPRGRWTKITGVNTQKPVRKLFRESEVLEQVPSFPPEVILPPNPVP